MSPLTLETELKRAAAERDWSRVVHRCAWCGRIADAQGDYVASPELHEDTPVTDGMCPACGTRQLALLAGRRLARQRPAA
jgi:hypothetical protein